tara:strand:- start:539 stop:820 length:282 start_codon:yes stop_codon:yes gene_type:complete
MGKWMFEEIENSVTEEDIERNETPRWEVGDMVVCHEFNDLVGEVTKRSLNGDMKYDYMVSYSDGAIVWAEFEDLREANDLDDWRLAGREMWTI